MLLVVIICLIGLLGLYALTLYRHKKDAEEFEKFLNSTYRKRYTE